MTSRSYALTLIVGAATLLLGLAATNVMLDPWWVFRVSPVSRPGYNGNDRYDFYRAYADAPDRYDALLLSSSRGLEFRLDELSRFSNGDTYAAFSVSFGRIADHLEVLEFVLRDKAARGKRLKDVFLLIDLDTFGEAPRPSDELQLLQPPDVSGDPAFRFWWKNLTAIQVPAWRRALADSGVLAPPRRTLGTAASVPKRADPNGSGAKTATDVAAREQLAERAVAAAGIVDSRIATGRLADRPMFADDLRMWRRIVALCRDNDIRLVTALSPMFPATVAGLDPDDVAKAVDRISLVAPVWDFTGPREPSNRLDLWWDPRHFHPLVAQMMLGRMFGGDVAGEWSDFGRLRVPAGQ
jgi:hypothetical protein